MKLLTVSQTCSSSVVCAPMQPIATHAQQWRGLYISLRLTAIVAMGEQQGGQHARLCLAFLVSPVILSLQS